ncbi:hypothetical protein CY34DRAFT_9460 [Suillus luteus UH-Slu-Lm8-n1]|uniref:Uncharacterized protein n=1 Tax=Suillus luteus UH-Slu-Lm8-n1 TaxID=930992 RepID=A0A0D0BAI5_9AGAM|nr:hypothetical protein CY34DRAFT_9460 [Suillus luteus UH-Slu-Lm8-n1]
MPHFQRHPFSWADCEDPDILALTAATQLPPDRSVRHYSGITEPSWLPRLNSFNSGHSDYSSHDASEHGSPVLMDDHYRANHSPADAPDALICYPDFGQSHEEPMTLGRWLRLLGRRARRASGYL